VIASYPNVYQYEGVCWVLDAGSPLATQNLYRFYNRTNGTHFYTASESEKASVIAYQAATYQYEGPVYKVTLAPVGGELTVYRFYYIPIGSHFYTSSAEERDRIIANYSNVYVYDGPAFYVPTPESSFGYSGMRWPGTSTYWSLDNVSPVPVAWIPAIEASAATWSSSGSRFRFIRNESIGDQTGCTVASKYMGPTYGIGTSFTTPGSQMTKVYTVLNTYYALGVTYDVQNLMTHEFGHWLRLIDLNASWDTEKTMYGWGAAGETKKRSLHPADSGGIKYIYGQ